MIRKFIARNGNGFSSCYMCASKEKYSSEWDSSLYTDTKYGLPICYNCIREKIKYEQLLLIEHHNGIEEITKEGEQNA